MINLLPEDSKKELRAARMNVTLLRYNIITVATLGLLILVVVGFYVYLVSAQANAETAKRESDSQTDQYRDTANEAKTYRENLATAKQILDNQINYSSVIFDITKLLPRGVVLNSLNLSASDFGNQTTITANAKDYAAVTNLKKNFEKKEKEKAKDMLFSNVYFQTIDNTDESNKEYPLKVSISVKINKVNP